MQANSYQKCNPSHIPTLMVESELLDKDVEVPIKDAAQAKIKKLVAKYPDRAVQAIRVWMSEDC